MAFDGYASFAFKIHVVEYLRLQVFGGNGVGVLKQSVGKSALAVIDVCYDAKISYPFHRVQNYI
jgi:hypothetical protein